VGALVASSGWLACGDEGALAPLPVGPEVERDAWVDPPSLVSGSGEDELCLGRETPGITASPNVPREANFSLRWRRSRAIALDVLSGFAGLVVVDAADPAASRVESIAPSRGTRFARGTKRHRARDRQ
jgi:hypothetical protein